MNIRLRNLHEVRSANTQRNKPWTRTYRGGWICRQEEQSTDLCTYHCGERSVLVHRFWRMIEYKYLNIYCTSVLVCILFDVVRTHSGSHISSSQWTDGVETRSACYRRAALRWRTHPRRETKRGQVDWGRGIAASCFTCSPTMYRYTLNSRLWFQMRRATKRPADYLKELPPIPAVTFAVSSFRWNCQQRDGRLLRVLLELK